jgi:precorrin-6A/cobalt-precorrin-6A reductase
MGPEMQTEAALQRWRDEIRYLHMIPMKRLLILGGTGDAARLIDQAAQLPGVEVIASLAGRTPQPNLPTVPFRLGGFGGVAGLTAYLQAENIDLLIDATHPFAAQISWNAAAAAEQVGILRLRVDRPQWEPEAADRWLSVPDYAAAADCLPNLADRVFLTIGRQELGAFAGVTGVWFLMRMITPPEGLIPEGDLLLRQGPFTVADEITLLRSYQIGAIVSKNSGGAATYAKIVAARELGLPVVMIPRSAMPPGTVVASVQAAVEWLQRQV